jgi:hypothetical protein
LSPGEETFFARRIESLEVFHFHGRLLEGYSRARDRFSFNIINGLQGGFRPTTFLQVRQLRPDDRALIIGQVGAAQD